MAKVDTLKEIVAKKKERLVLSKQQFPEDDLKARVAGLAICRPFKEAISKVRQISLIAEIKQSSPSKGLIRQNFNLQEITKSYQEAGVQAVSVLTEEDFFGGSPLYINEVKNIITAPVLRKDFILEGYQVYESRYLGADAILLIADLLSKDKLTELMQIADSLGMDYLVEVHDEKELKKVLNLKVPIIGINNRNLHTLEVDFKTTEKLFTLIPRDKLVVVESGIKNYQDILFLKILGASAVLIGTAFMEAEDIKRKVEEVMGW
ncbi:MAG: indole-3-glycerol phosphate synthase TrpC [Candidatus Omnitrophica bacterium]|nr:indole-3-glycerol phosphate synthase TrpC [Candidatus Omnitrophota bacterium]MDD5690159.1 indole-3-glycerol phosphate synthase TrpC [Candidatus Omnitrophota bacterium]